MCDCGCNTCETKSTLMLNESLAPRDILSEGLKHHMDANKPLTEHLYRAGSDSYFNLWAEARSLYSRNILEITHKDDLAVLTETNLGHYGLLEQTSTVSKRRAEAELKQKLKGVRSDGFGKYDATVYGLDSDGKRVELKSLNDLNKFDKFELAENKKVPLDFPIELNEQMDLEDELANMEFGMDYDQLGDNEKEWVRDEMDNMSMNEEVNNSDLDNAVYRLENVYKYLDIEYKETKRGEKYIQINYIPVTSPQSQNPEWVNVRYNNDEDLKIIKNRLDFPMVNEAKKDIYDKFLDNPQNPKGRAKAVIFKFLKQYGEDASQMAVDRFAKQNNLTPKEKYILKYITKQDIKISSQPGGPDFSALNEAKNDNKKLNKPTRDSSGGKAYKVYVKDPKTKKIKTVRFGSGGLKAKINNKEARNAFAARHKCSTKKDKTKAGYWSCRLPRYAKLLGLKSNFGGFW